jgi:glucokinase
MIDRHSAAPLFLGIEIGGTKLQVLVGGPDGTVVGGRRMNVGSGANARTIRSSIESAVRELSGEYSFVGAGIGFGGPVDVEKGSVVVSFQVEGWADFPICDWLKEITGAPAVLENDANIAALAEAHAGAGKNCGKVFYITLGSGMGGGYVVDGNIYHGSVPGESEIGLSYVDRDGTTLESCCCGWSIDRKIRDTMEQRPDGVLARLSEDQDGAEARYLLPAVEQNDPDAIEILDDLGRDLAFGVSQITYFLNPDIAIIGGGLSNVGGPLVESVEKHLPEYISPSFQPGPKIALAGLGEEVVAVGGILLAAAKVGNWATPQGTPKALD